jgi:hypothetical protein
MLNLEKQKQSDPQRQKVMKCIITATIFGVMGWVGGTMAYGAHFIPGAIVLRSLSPAWSS